MRRRGEEDRRLGTLLRLRERAAVEARRRLAAALRGLEEALAETERRRAALAGSSAGGTRHLEGGRAGSMLACSLREGWRRRRERELASEAAEAAAVAGAAELAVAQAKQSAGSARAASRAVEALRCDRQARRRVERERAAEIESEEVARGPGCREAGG
jgi:hypothetical protein